MVGPARIRSVVRSGLLLVAIVGVAYVAGYRFETAVLRIEPTGPTRGSVAVNRLAGSEVPACLSVAGSFNVHPRDFEGTIHVEEGAVRAEYAVYRGSRIVRRVSGTATAGEGLTLRGTAFSTRLEPTSAPTECHMSLAHR